ncbi:phage tail tape measure C-terminal domain-containing protein [Variovorax ginsengisoli]|uniref:Phage tail tape measure C-terminal domain-containing protein n=1 Tax=Variovorax ginsengisoli TaxID=363844 RepID=A0ABT8RZ78_9BURK|nr:phage tail tape measure C-terminal domain-containing protein [Variovorax ginsengisoli]MDN8612801.1 phage tail tape measure C-terminal domain-containing protein [Variovorax ginsengisoli]MDO1531971.1 phage tail tape measure C-terminal domain-containing protein [Variovorax ginsengisoli]
MTDFAALGIKIDSSQARQATKDLDALAAVGDKVASSIAETENASKKLGKTLDAGAKAARDSASSIDKYVQNLQKVAATNGLTTREAKLYELALQGATKAQLQAADTAIKLDEGYKRGLATGQKIREGFSATAAAAVKLGAALSAAAVGGVVLFNKVNESIAKWQELSEKTGETAENISSLQTASDVSGVSLDTVAAASIRLSTALAKTDDESKLVAKGVKALGLNFQEFKQFSPAQQLDAVAKAMSGLANGTDKTAAITAIYGKNAAEIIPFLNDLADGGERQIRLTDAQIQAADEHSKAQARLRSEITALAQVVVSQSLPAVTDLTGAIKDAITETVGLGGAANDLAKNQGIADFATEGARFLATLVDMTGNVAAGFLYVGKTIGGVAAAAASAARGEFRAIGGIIDGVSEDFGKISNRGSVADALDKRIAERTANAAAKRREDRGFTPEKPRAGSINTDRVKKGRDTAGQEAKAQLAFDLEDIRKAQEAITNTIANGEKVLDAKRAANLITEAAYWDQKKQFLVDNNQAQQQGLEKELARLQQEELSGKDQINNARKILDVEAKLAKARQDGATELQVLAIRQADALDKIRIKYEEATSAAKFYVDTIARQNDREIAGMGKGNLNREIDARKNQRDDQFQSRRNDLDTQRRANQITSEEYDKFLAIEADAHARSLALDEKYWKEKLAKQQDWAVGASEALQNFIDEANNVAKTTEGILSNGLGGLSDSLTAELMGEDGKWLDLGKNLGRQIIKGMVDKEIIAPLASFAQDALKSLGGGGDGLSGLLSSVTGSKGGTGAAAAATSTAALATSATGATAAITTLAAAATAAAAAMGGSSISSALGLANSVGSSGGDALGSLISSMGWSEGGYTGPGTKYQPAGIVHAGEYVVNAENTRRLGLSFLERLNKRGYAEGGYVNSIVGGNLAAPQGSPGGGGVVNNFHVDVHGQVDRRTRTQIANDLSLVQRRAGRMG